MHESATKCNETIGKWCKNKHGASKIIDMFETYQPACSSQHYFGLEATHVIYLPNDQTTPMLWLPIYMGHSPPL
jgi:hypothetical protein